MQEALNYLRLLPMVLTQLAWHCCVASDLTYTLPGTVTGGQFLTTDGSGNLSFAEVSTTYDCGHSGSNDTVTVGTNTLTFEGTANEIETTANNKINIGFPTNVTISGNLTVSGTTTTVSSTTVNVADSMLSLATKQLHDAVDIGFYALYDDSKQDSAQVSSVMQQTRSGSYSKTQQHHYNCKCFWNWLCNSNSSTNLESSAVDITGGTITGITDLAVADGGTGLSAIAKGSILAANSANVLSAVDGGGSTDKILLYTASSDTVGWSNTIDGGTYS